MQGQEIEMDNDQRFLSYYSIEPGDVIQVKIWRTVVRSGFPAYHLSVDRISFFPHASIRLWTTGTASRLVLFLYVHRPIWREGNWNNRRTNNLERINVVRFVHSDKFEPYSLHNSWKRSYSHMDGQKDGWTNVWMDSCWTVYLYLFIVEKG